MIEKSDSGEGKTKYVDVREQVPRDLHIEERRGKIQPVYEGMPWVQQLV